MIETLTKRADFLAAAKARRQSTPGFTLQARKRAEDGGEALRVGYTCSKKVGNAVARNRAKRRLRAIARSVLTTKGQSGWDYVLIGRAAVTASRSYQMLHDDLEHALGKIHKARR